MLLYIDPGTGSMLFTVLIGVLGTCGYLLRNVWVRLRFLFSGGIKGKHQEKDHIPFAVFSDSKRYWNLFEPICDEFEKRQQPLVYMTASSDDPALHKEYQYVKCFFIGEGNRAFMKLNFLQADILLSTTPGLDVYQWKRSKGVKWYVHILHAASDIAMYRMFGIDYYDAILLSGDYQIKQVRELERLRGLPAKELELVGVPYLDVMKRRLDNEVALTRHETTILLAPSWGQSGILSLYGGAIIDALLDTGYHLIIRPHPQSFDSEKELLDSLLQAYPESNQLEWNRDNDNFDVLKRSDILISDFSGVIFDYALIFQKPVLYTDISYDTAPYDACWLDEELWTFTTLPKIGRQLAKADFSNMKKVIDDLLNNKKYREAIDIARKETWAHIGESAALTVDYMIKKAGDLSAPRKDGNEAPNVL